MVVITVVVVIEAVILRENARRVLYNQVCGCGYIDDGATTSLVPEPNLGLDFHARRLF